MISQANPVTVPRMAATVLIVRDGPFEVLMVKRNAKGQYASALVFPGGVIETEDAAEAWLPFIQGGMALDAAERAFRVGACREVFEETALALTIPPVASPGRPEENGFLQFIRGQGVKLNLDAFVDFAHWLTPEFAPKRFDTRFFIVQAPPGHQAVSDGVETVSLVWIAPEAALRAVAAGELSIAFPTRMNLARLAESADAGSAMAAAQARPYFRVTPAVVETPNGRSVRIPLEAGYGMTGDDLPPI